MRIFLQQGIENQFYQNRNCVPDAKSNLVKAINSAPPADLKSSQLGLLILPLEISSPETPETGEKPQEEILYGKEQDSGGTGTDLKEVPDKSPLTGKTATEEDLESIQQGIQTSREITDPKSSKKTPQDPILMKISWIMKEIFSKPKWLLLTTLLLMILGFVIYINVNIKEAQRDDSKDESSAVSLAPPESDLTA